MTLTPCDLAFASMAAPDPESRLTSSRTLAPFVMACSACCCWVDLSPSAFWMVASTPAALNACASSGRSAVSQRSDDFVSGSSTATLSAFALELPELLLELLLLLLSLPPQAATPSDSAHNAPANARARREIGERITCSSSVDGTCVGPEASGGRRPRAPPGRARRVPRRARRGPPP